MPPPCDMPREADRPLDGNDGESTTAEPDSQRRTGFCPHQAVTWSRRS